MLGFGSIADDVIGATPQALPQQTQALMFGSIGCCCSPNPDCLMQPCGNCNIPKTDLKIEWTNPILGNGSTTMKNTNGIWASGCSNELLYQLLCVSNQLEFRANYFISGPCPTGTRQYCSNLRPNPFRLTQTKLTCGQDFEMDLTVGPMACPVLSANGFTSFKITSPSTTGKPTPRCRVCFGVNGCDAPIPGATVTVSGGPGSGGSGISDSNGFVAIDIGTAGTYMVTTSASGYRTTIQSTTLECGKSYPVILSANLTFRLTWSNLQKRKIIDGTCVDDPCIGKSGSVTLNFSGGSWRGPNRLQINPIPRDPVPGSVYCGNIFIASRQPLIGFVAGCSLALGWAFEIFITDQFGNFGGDIYKGDKFDAVTYSTSPVMGTWQFNQGVCGIGTITLSS